MNLKQKVSKGVLWTTIDRFATQIVQFVLSIIIARILSPSDYGVMAIVLIFVNLSQVIVDSGFGNALIQSNSPSKADCSTVFYFNLAISILLFSIVWLCSPFIARFYENSELVLLLRTCSVIIVINAITIVHQALISIRFDFKLLAIASFVSTLISGSAGVALAVLDFKIWALVAQNILRVVTFGALVLILVRWKPIFSFSIESFRRLYKFGINIFATSFVSVIVSELSTILIGKFYKPDALGFYSRGVQFATIPFLTFYSIVNKVLFPTFSSLKGNKDKLVLIAGQSVKMVGLMTFPIFIWLGLNATPIIEVLLTEKWLPAAPILQVFCASRLISIIASINQDLLNSIGRSDLTFRQTLLKLIVRAIFIFSAISFGIFWLAVADLIATCIHFFINTYYPGKLLKFGALFQIKMLIPILSAAAISCTLGFMASGLLDHIAYKLVISMTISILLYLPLLLLFRQKPNIMMMKSIAIDSFTKPKI